jgi:3-oxoacyl-[acyl-carrier protein] reductase
LEISEEEWERILEINLKGVFNVCKMAASIMIPQKSGKIINISSIVGRMGSRTGVAYAASKAGIIGLSLALATELAPYGINVNVVAPRAIDTEWYEPEEKKSLAEKCPLRRLGKPEEVAKAVIFLIENDYITGEILNVDGGRFLRKL